MDLFLKIDPTTRKLLQGQILFVLVLCVAAICGTCIMWLHPNAILILPTLFVLIGILVLFRWMHILHVIMKDEAASFVLCQPEELVQSATRFESLIVHRFDIIHINQNCTAIMGNGHLMILPY